VRVVGQDTAYQPQQRRAASHERELADQPSAGPTAQGEAHRLQECGQSRGTACVNRYQRRQPFAEEAA
jgi:hypothetical protein